MNSSQDIQTQISEALRRRNDAVQAERERQEREQAAAREIEAADAALEQLRIQQRHEELNAAKARMSHFAANCSAEAKRFTDWLDSPDTRLSELVNATNPMSRYERSLEQEAAHFNVIADLAVEIADDESGAIGESSGEKTRYRHRVEQLAGTPSKSLTSHQVVATWVAKTRFGTAERELRVRLSHLLTGKFYDPQDGWRPTIEHYKVFQR